MQKDKTIKREKCPGTHTAQGSQVVGGNTLVTYSAANEGPNCVFTSYIGPYTKNCLINGQHIPYSPRADLSLTEPPSWHLYE